MRWAPATLILLLAGLALLGKNLRAYETGANPHCNYVLAEQDLEPADVLLIGPSRVRRGLDPDYTQALAADAGLELSVERLSLNLPDFSQYYPLLTRYLDKRGPPRIAYLQLAYNFKPERQDTWGLPLNPLRNLAFGQWSDLVAVQRGAPLNDTGTALPRQVHSAYQTLPAAWLTRFEMNVFSALRYLPKRLRGLLPNCTGDRLRANGMGTGAYGMTPQTADEIAFAAPDPAALSDWRAEVAGFLPLAPDAPWRRGETAQLRRLVDLLETAGTTVVFLIMPALDQKTVGAETIAQVNAVFPGIDIFFPMDAYSGNLADLVSVSFADTHHANAFGSVHFSRALADDLIARQAAQ